LLHLRQLQARSSAPPRRVGHPDRRAVLGSPVDNPGVTPVPPARHLLRAKDLIDARYREPLDVPAIARAARLSSAHFSREFRAAQLLRTTDRTVADVCLSVGLRSVGSFTTSFSRTYGLSPTAYRAAHPPAADRARIPTCMVRAWARPGSSTFGEDRPA
jgi:AraC-like DNA-binding protein